MSGSSDEFEQIEVKTTSEAPSERAASPSPSDTSSADTETAADDGKKDDARIEIRFGKRSEPFYFLASASSARICYNGATFACAEDLLKEVQLEAEPGVQQATGSPTPSEDIASTQVSNDQVRKLNLMREIQRLKFSQNAQLQARLLQTDDMVLIHHDDKDTFWGVDKDGQGHNHLGQILMDLRCALRMDAAPALLLSAYKAHPTTSSAFWSSHPDDTTQWYQSDSTGSYLSGLVVSPALETMDASHPAFLHGLAHGGAPWQLDVIIQVQNGYEDGVSLKWSHKGARYFWENTRRLSASDSIRTLMRENRRSFALYRITLQLPTQPGEWQTNATLSWTSSSSSSMNSSTFDITATVTKEHHTSFVHKRAG
ncbi:hypothetical protein OC842_007604 [Tilletia horrida]|uniref:NADAR domain-containing protein n=1 Tax=Tilletia horrida TaxID=155126 RepID=A0AAN6JGK6_9BASI|nr:hypothetical protein OC842_007604 [Tilletia horrida]